MTDSGVARLFDVLQSLFMFVLCRRGNNYKST